MNINPVGVATNALVTPQAEQPARSPLINAEAAAAPAARPTTPTAEQIQAATRQVQDMVQSKASNLVFSLDKDSGKTIVKIVDSQTEEVIRQIPSEEMVALAHALDQMQELQGVLLKGKA